MIRNQPTNQPTSSYLNTYRPESHDNTHRNDAINAPPSDDRKNQRADDSEEYPAAHDLFTAVSLREPPTKHLGDDVAVEERTQDQTLQLLVPLKFSL